MMLLGAASDCMFIGTVCRSAEFARMLWLLYVLAIRAHMRIEN